MRLRILTYNIHKGIGGVDRRYRLDRIVEVIRHYRPNVALLQEVDTGAPRSHGDAQADLLAEQLDLPYRLFQPNVKLRRGAYGNAILSDRPLHEPIDVDLTVRPKERRRAQVARLHLERGGHRRSLVVVNLHLGLASIERRIQLRRLFRERPLHGLHQDTPCVIAGDFNDFWGAIGDRLMKPSGFERSGGLLRTFPAFAPVRPLDSIYIRGDCHADHAFAGRVRLAREASDHLPLIAEIEVPIHAST